MKHRYTVLTSGNGRALVVDNVKKRLGKMRHRLFAWARVVTDAGYKSLYRVAMVTLTYDVYGTLVSPARWEVGHIRDFMHRLKKRMGERLKAAAWVGELQDNGHVHYHVMVIFEGRFLYPDKACIIDGVRYTRLWPHGMSNVRFRVRTLHYICSYVGKEYQKNFMEFPDHAHAWAAYVRDSYWAERLKYLSLHELEQRIVDEFGWISLKSGKWSSNEHREDGDKLYYRGSAYSKDYAAILAGEA
jgi:hypothetical protein